MNALEKIGARGVSSIFRESTYKIAAEFPQGTCRNLCLCDGLW
jgi:hypothetical protein